MRRIQNTGVGVGGGLGGGEVTVKGQVVQYKVHTRKNTTMTARRCPSPGVEHVGGTPQVNQALGSYQEGREPTFSGHGSEKLAEVPSLERGIIRSAHKEGFPGCSVQEQIRGGNF